MSDACPRVLLINQQPISRRHATGIAMGNLFRGWPPGRIAQIYSDDSEPDETVCPTSWRLEVEDVPMPAFLRRHVTRWRRGRRAHQADLPGAAVSGGDHDKPSRPQAGLSRAKEAARRAADYLPCELPPDVVGAIRRFDPDVVYSVLEDRRITGLALDVASRLSIPLVPHYMDDWMAMPAAQPRGPLQKWARRDLEAKALRVLHQAPSRLVISPDMAAAYAHRYGHAFLPFANCVDPAERPAITHAASQRGPFRLGFSGRLLHSREAAMADVLRALEGASESGTAEVVVYQAGRDDSWLDVLRSSELVRLADATEESLLETEHCDLDAFLHVDSFDAQAVEYLRYSISGKVPWYLAAGIPLLAYGAPGTGTMRFLHEQRCAVVVDRRDEVLLRQRIGDLIADAGMRQDLGAAAQAVFQRFFDARVQREAFRRALAEAAHGRAQTGDE